MEQNGIYLYEGDSKLGVGEEDEVNGNLLEIDVEGYSEVMKGNLNQQYEKVKVQYGKIMVQYQVVFLVMQLVQVLFEKQGYYLFFEEKEKLQKNMQELKVYYEKVLVECEKKVKLMYFLQEELEKFDIDYSEFEYWLQQFE